MKKNHISYFKIENFKRFKSLEINDIGQINLIVGKNNIGKTSVLESLLFSDDRVELLKNYHKTLCFRELHIHPTPEFEGNQIVSLNFPKESYLNYIFKDIELPLTIQYANGSPEKHELKIVALDVSELTDEDQNFPHSPMFPNFQPKQWLRFYVNGELKEVDWLGIDELVLHDRPIPFIPMNRGYKKDLIEIFSNYIQKSKSARKEFTKNLKILVPSLDEVLLSKVNDKEILSISVEGQDESIPLTNMGDGAIRLARILLEIGRSKNKRLMIDEASIGIHHGKLKEFWTIIMKACFRNNVQLFATTHSYESLESFIEAANNYENGKHENLLRCIQITNVLGEQQITKAHSVTFSFKEFKSILSTKTEIRD